MGKNNDSRLIKRLFTVCAQIISSAFAALRYPLNIARLAFVGKRYLLKGLAGNRRVFDYVHSLLPNDYLSEMENKSRDIESAIKVTGLSMGYPAWGLLYYSIYCSLNGLDREVVVLETGTNQGFSTIIMAQALADIKARGFIRTVDIDSANIKAAKDNVERAGLSRFVKFYNEDAVGFLRRFTGEVRYIDFAFIDDLHEYFHVKKEFSIVYPKVVACNGKVYFDNTSAGDLSRAMRYIKRAYPGHMIEFSNCSWNPPGNAIWQPF